MKRLLATCVMALLVVGTANAQLRIYLDPVGVGVQEARTVETDYGNPVVGPGAGRLYIYGEFLENDALWLGVSFNINIDTGDATFTDMVRYNTFTQLGPRWSGPVVGGFINNPQNASFRAAAIVNPQVSAGGLWNWDAAEATAHTGSPFPNADDRDANHYRRACDSHGGGRGTTLLGYFDYAENTGGSSDVFMTVEDPAFALYLGGNGRVNFGYGDDSVAGNELGVRTTMADATIVPEPASLMLLGLGALALRRRR